MSTLGQLQPNAAVRGIIPDALATVVSVQWFGSEALELTYKTPSGRVANELLYPSANSNWPPMRREVRGKVRGKSSNN